MPVMNSLTLRDPDIRALQAELDGLLSAENVNADASDLIFFSTDVYRRAAEDAVLIIRPPSAELLAKAVGICTKRGFAVVPRGAGLSYTGGYLPVDRRTVIIDLGSLTKILTINAEDMYVTVETGCSWRSLYEALRPLGLRTPYFGPMSGYASTVGGALSQGSIFLGSTQFGTTAESTLGVEVVLADGTLLTTGSAGGVHCDSPFFRTFGPDLTGLFLNDCGAMGIKTKATLRLIRNPGFSGFLTFTFESHNDLFAAMSEVSRQSLAAECYGADPYIWNMRLWDNDVGTDLTRLAGVVKANRSVIGGIKDAVRMATAGRRSLGTVEFAMNIAIDGDSQGEIDEAMARIRQIAKAGREVEASAPRAVRGTPFMPPDDLLGPRGQRWAPIHGIAPHSKAAEIATAMHAYFEGRAEDMAALGIEWGYVSFAISTNAILTEPMLYWPGKREIYHDRMVSAKRLAKLETYPDSPEVIEFIASIRRDLIALWSKAGCAHLQIGKAYPFLETREPGPKALLQALKRVVDPDGRMNPGSIGLE
jgi:FAD/FMN-containing dehydrogenase